MKFKKQIGKNVAHQHREYKTSRAQRRANKEQGNDFSHIDVNRVLAGYDEARGIDQSAVMRVDSPPRRSTHPDFSVLERRIAEFTSQFSVSTSSVASWLSSNLVDRRHQLDDLRYQEAARRQVTGTGRIRGNYGIQEASVQMVRSASQVFSSILPEPEPDEYRLLQDQIAQHLAQSLDNALMYSPAANPLRPLAGNVIMASLNQEFVVGGKKVPGSYLRIAGNRMKIDGVAVTFDEQRQLIRLESVNGSSPGKIQEAFESIKRLANDLFEEDTRHPEAGRVYRRWRSVEGVAVQDVRQPDGSLRRVVAGTNQKDESQ